MEIEGPRWAPSISKAVPTSPTSDTLIGARTVSPFNGSGDWIIAAGQGQPLALRRHRLEGRDRFEGLVGWEFHGDPAHPRPGRHRDREDHNG